MLGLFLMGTLFFFCSCVDDTYDLNKGITTDVALKDNKLSLPLGSLRTVMLDSLINVDSLDFLNKKDGIYSISMADTIAPYEYEMPEIKFAIPAQKANVSVDDFAKAEITEVSIEAQSPTETQFDVPSISLDGLEIPAMNTDRSVSAANDMVKDILKEYEGADGQIIETLAPIPFDQTFELSDGKVEFDMSYELPKEIEAIYTIYLQKGDDDKDSKDGALIGFDIIHPVALTGLDKIIDFEINFPEEFNVSLAPNAGGKYSLINNGRTILVEGLSAKAGDTKNSTIQFYINSLTDLDRKIENGVLSLEEIITYSVKYHVNGSLKLKSGSTLEDFNFKVKTDLELGFRDVEGRTNDIEVEFEPITMDFDIDFNDLQYIDRIEIIDFDASNSKLHFHTEMEGGFAPFSLKEGYALKLEFPKELIIDDRLSVYPRKTLDGRKAVEYNEIEHAFYIYDLEVFNSLIEDKDKNGNPIYYHWALALDKFELHAPVVNGEFHHKVEALVTVDYNGEPVENLVLASTYLESMGQTLESLETKEVKFEIWNSDFIIDDAIVHTEKIISDLEHTITFEFDNNDLPKEINRIEAIGFNGETPVLFNIKINGLEDLDTHITLDLHVNLPTALEITSNDKRVEIIDNTLYMEVEVDPSSQAPAVVELQCNGLNFTKGTENSNGLRPEIRNDKGYIEYKSDIDIVGKVIVEGSEFHAEILENNDISVDVDFEIGDIQVKDFHGIFYIDNLGGIEETFDLNLGDNLDFLKAEGNTIVLSDPQIQIAVNNSISIPIAANLSLIGKDENGLVIESSIVECEIQIDPADYDPSTGEVTPRSTNLLLTAHPLEKEGYKNQPIENLANLLKQIPSSLDIVLTPVIDTLNTQHINLVQPLSFSGNYDVSIPFQFDEFSFVYSDTISNLSTSLGEIMELFSNVRLGLNMNIQNSMPLQLQLKATPLDELGDTIHGLKISGIEIPAGSGSAFNDTILGKAVKFNIESSSTNDIETLDKLKFDIQAKANSTVGGAALRGDQGIKLGNIVIEVAGDISTNLSE